MSSIRRLRQKQEAIIERITGVRRRKLPGATNPPGRRIRHCIPTHRKTYSRSEMSGKRRVNMRLRHIFNLGKKKKSVTVAGRKKDRK